MWKWFCSMYQENFWEKKNHIFIGIAISEIFDVYEKLAKQQQLFMHNFFFFLTGSK